MSKHVNITAGHYVLISNKRDPLRAYPKRYWDVEIVETAGAKCEHGRWHGGRRQWNKNGRARWIQGTR